MKFVKLNEIEWQTPVITEKFAFRNLWVHYGDDFPNVVYLAIPWATLLDKYNSLYSGRFDSFISFFENEFQLNFILDNNESTVVTVCQSIHYRILLPLFQKLKVEYLFTPHAIKKEHDSYVVKHNIKILPFPLFPVAVQKPIKVETKEYLFSFVGCTEYAKFSDYAIRATKVRSQMVEYAAHREDSYIRARNKWHFNDIVYKKQILNKTLESDSMLKLDQDEQEYTAVLKKSRFSLCPLGTGPSSIRFWESLGAGAIPIIIADDFWLPEEENFNWSTCCIRIPEDNINNLLEIVQSISLKQELSLRAGCYQAYNFFSDSNFVRNLVSELKKY